MIANRRSFQIESKPPSIGPTCVSACDSHSNCGEVMPAEESSRR